MGIFIDGVKLKAAAGSMQQFYATIRAVFPDSPDDGTVEAATSFIYVLVATDVFDRRFAGRLRRRLATQYKFASPVVIEESVRRIERFNELFHRASEDAPDDPEGFAEHVRCIICAILAEAGFAQDEEVVRACFPRFENAVRRIKTHLSGIKKQNHFVMKR